MKKIKINRLRIPNWLVAMLFMVKKALYRILVYSSRIFYEVQKENIKEITYY